MPYLLLNLPEGTLASFPLSGDRLTIGRDVANDVFLPDPSVSRNHARIEALDRGGFAVRDQGSLNGVLLNGERVESGVLSDGDRIGIGIYRFLFRTKQAGQNLLTRTVSLDRSIALEGRLGPIGADKALSALASAARSFRSSGDARLLFAELAPLLERTLEPDALHFSLTGLGAEPLEFVAQTGGAGEIEIRTGQPMDNPYLLQILEEGRAAILNNPRIRAAGSLPQKEGGTAICAPIAGGSVLLGYLYAERAASREFTPSELEFASASGYFLGLCLENSRTIRELRRNARTPALQRIVGASDAIGEVKAAVARYAPSRSPVLITGASGTGKELVARAIHEQSLRADGPLVVFNCAAVPESLAESELFGHVRGAFTGALSDLRGRFELADGGTLFLDEVSEMSPSVQAKLLRAIELGEIERVGSEKTTKVDIRIVAATNQDLERETAAGRFREDLFYRLNVLAIHIPSLSQRREDIPVLARHFLAEIKREAATGIDELPGEALEILSLHDWPGNARQLRNVIERAIHVASDEKELTAFFKAGGQGKDAMSGPTIPFALSDVIADVERRHLEKVLGQCDWNKSRAARLLNITRQTLERKIRAYGLKRVRSRD